jgi:hypothetical protein
MSRVGQHVEKTTVIRLFPSPRRWLAVAAIVSLATLLAACASGGDGGDGTPPPEASPTAPAIDATEPSAQLTTEEAIAAGTLSAGHILQDSAPDLTSATLDGGVWTVTLKGMFYEPAATTPTSGPREPICAEVIVLVDDATSQYTELTFQQASGC